MRAGVDLPLSESIRTRLTAFYSNYDGNIFNDAGGVSRRVNGYDRYGVRGIIEADVTETVKLMGHVRPTFFGEYFDVRTHIKPTNLAYTAKALEMHTDTPAEDEAPGVQFLQLRLQLLPLGQLVGHGVDEGLSIRWGGRVLVHR